VDEFKARKSPEEKKSARGFEETDAGLILKRLHSQLRAAGKGSIALEQQRARIRDILKGAGANSDTRNTTETAAAAAAVQSSPIDRPFGSPS
jgi:hypothetical protein